MQSRKEYIFTLYKERTARYCVRDRQIKKSTASKCVLDHKRSDYENVKKKINYTHQPT